MISSKNQFQTQMTYPESCPEEVKGICHSYMRGLKRYDSLNV